MLIKIGHRGAMGYEPENTLRSFQKAIELGADMVELDVHLCKSGELVVIHDDTVNRTTNGRGFVVKMTLAELKKLDAGKGQTIPTLGEVLDFVDKRVGVNIELKGKKTAKAVADTVRHYVSRGWSENAFIVSSFDQKELREFRQYNSNARVGALMRSKIRILRGKEIRDLLDFAKLIRAYSIHVPLRKFSVNFLRQARELDFKVFVWTVDSPDDIEKLKEAGVDGIFSNFPDRLKQFN